jgi:integrase
MLAAIRAPNDRHFAFVTTRAGTSRSSKSVSQWFAAKARAAEIVGKTAHGLRKRRDVLLIKAGATVPQAAAWIGHDDLRTLSCHAMKHDRRKLLTGP